MDRLARILPPCSRDFAAYQDMGATRRIIMKRARQKGIAAIEVALALPFLIAMIMVVVEASDMLHSYSTVQDASREGARSYVRKGNSSEVATVVNTIMAKLPSTNVITNVTTDAGANTVTVEVKYDYSSFFNANQLLSMLNSGPVTLRSATTMPKQ
jgi:Flp pilus assembly protein TadG